MGYLEQNLTYISNIKNDTISLRIDGFWASKSLRYLNLQLR